MYNSKTNVALTDELPASRRRIDGTVRNFGSYMVIFEARDGKDAFGKVQQLKEMEPADLKRALESILNQGIYYSETVAGRFVRTHNASPDTAQRGRRLVNLNEREVDFLKKVCTEMTYKEIAEQMCLSPRTIDGYRDTLFEKLKVKTRVGLVLYAIRNGVVVP